MAAPAQAIILFAHGARDPQWAQPFARLQHLLRARMPTAIIELAYLEHMTPSLEDAIAGLAAQDVRQITVVPVFMSSGRHLKADLPRQLDALRARYPQVALAVTPATGEAEAVLAAMAGWIGQITGAS